MKARLKIIITGVVCLVLCLGFAVPALAATKPITFDLTLNQYDSFVCSRCGKTISGAPGEENQIAKALGLTICSSCWWQMLYGNDSTPLPTVSLLDEAGKVPAIQLGGTNPKGSGLFLSSERIWTSVSGGSAVWGGITGILSEQTDLGIALGGKLSAITGTELDNIFSTNGFLKRTGAGTYVVDEGSFTELDPVFEGSVAHGIASGDITSWNGKLSSITGSGLDNVFSSNGLLKRTGTATYTLDTTVYEDSANKGVVSGYAGLDAGSKVPTINLGGAGASGSTYLRGDQTWASVTASPPDPVSNISLVDEFMGGSLEAGEVGEMGWSFTTTAPTVTNSVANHPGIRRINTSATSGNANAFWLGAVATNDLIQFNEQWDFTYIVSIPTITTVSVFVGAMDAMVTAVGNQDRYGLEFNPATSAFWRMTTGNGTSSTSTNTDITVVAGTWYALRIVRTATGVDYYIDGALKGSISTTLPDTALSFGPQVQTLTTVARNLDVDLFKMTLALSRVGAK